MRRLAVCALALLTAASAAEVRPRARCLFRLRRGGRRRPARELGDPHDEALEELRRCSGLQFDPEVVEAFCRVGVQVATGAWGGAEAAA